jgi:sortase A
MRDKRPVDELSIEELERVLAIRKREERQGKLQRMQRAGRIVPAEMPRPAAPAPADALPAAITRALANEAAPRAPVAAAPPTAPRQAEVAPRFDEDYTDESYPERSRFWKSVMNQLLLLVEVVAVGGLLFIGYQMFSATNTLQRETANAAQIADEQRRANMPTLAPTPQIRLSEVVLPGGHIFTASGEAQFNLEEIPVALRPLVQTELIQPITSRPPPTRETALELSIPKLNIDQTIVQGTDWEALKLGIGQMLNGANPGDPVGNLVLSGHNDIYGEYFRYLDQLEVGDQFFVRTETQIYTYQVSSFKTVDPNDVSVLGSRGEATATLISCYPYRVNNKRYIVFAERVS